MKYDKKKKMNFVKNSIPVNCTVFTHFLCYFLSVIFKNHVRNVPCKQQVLPESGYECTDWSIFEEVGIIREKKPYIMIKTNTFLAILRI